MNALYYVLLIAGGYLLGSLSPSIVLSRKAWGIDIRDHGSHNAGTTNMLRVMGWRYGVLTFVFDLIKGVLPALIGLWTGLPYGAHAAGAAAVLGHGYPVFARFKGGKCVTTATGMLLVIQPAFVGIAMAIGIALCFITRIVSVSVLSTYLVATVLAFLLPGIPKPFAFLVLGVTILLFIRHKENIRRILRGEEKRLVVGKGKKEHLK